MRLSADVYLFNVTKYDICVQPKFLFNVHHISFSETPIHMQKRRTERTLPGELRTAPAHVPIKPSIISKPHPMTVQGNRHHWVNSLYYRPCRVYLYYRAIR